MSTSPKLRGVTDARNPKLSRRSLSPLHLLLPLLALASCGPQKPPASQVRPRDVTFHDVATRYRSEHPDLGEPGSALSHSGSLVGLWSTRVPEYSELQLAQGFFHVRDHRFLRTPDAPDFLRRESWLYPDDGCYSRAAIASRQLGDASFPSPAKIFIFGDLSAQTPNSPDGVVHWWFHVAPVVSVPVPGDRAGLSSSHPETWYVLDPTLEPSHPLTLTDWISRQTEDPSSVRIAVCEPHTYRPEDPCENPAKETEADSDNDEAFFLAQEWERQVELDRDPEVVLGAAPPWLER